MKNIKTIHNNCRPGEVSGPKIAGVDEAGRGPLAGPVVAAAVILNPQDPIAGLADSKKLSAKKREELAVQIRRRALTYAVALADVEEIDRLNILQASLLAMSRAVHDLACTPDRVLIDGNQKPPLDLPMETIVRGDQKIAEISAASILAKVERDRIMTEYDELYPGYGLAQHKGYPTRAHIAALNELGVLPIHRRTFAPVRKFL